LSFCLPLGQGKGDVVYLCRRYSAAEALETGLINRVVPPEELDSEVRLWCEEILSKSPTALKFAKYSFNWENEGSSRSGNP